MSPDEAVAVKTRLNGMAAKLRDGGWFDDGDALDEFAAMVERLLLALVDFT